MANRTGEQDTGDAAAPKRADARRNRARVLATAARLLAVDGVSVSFDEIARQAGVGVGTVYRHFPTREELFGTVVLDGMRQLTLRADELAGADDDPGAAFFRFFFLMVEQTVVNKALCEAFEDPAGPGSAAAADPGASLAFETALDRLLAKAKDVGAVRADLTATEVRVLVVAAVMAARAHESTGFTWRVAALVAGGLRPDDGRVPLPAPGADVTKLAPDACHETGRAAARCEVCGEPIAVGRPGRPARFCGATCRQRAHRDRNRAL
ncbi:TetR/AcrR family transcriptional regulator [Actinokineospora inagensis]|uniref:TetR/AcrR family transcriptional regulator n=1 Tax=Actinokineospora inagensis TaxID=103730 RepID=UPI0003F550C6|nr:TetR/AcrR family transcriptional regulator [Actinokineospora inagensis]